MSALISVLVKQISGSKIGPQENSWTKTILHKHISSGMKMVMTLQMKIYLPLDKMAAISQMISSDAFSLMKSFLFWLKFQLDRWDDATV